MCGKKQSGKTTSTTAIYGYHLTQRGIIPNAEFDEDGRMSVVYDRKKNEGIFFDIDSRDKSMLDFFSKNVWPHVKHTSFADALKNSCIELFSLDPNKIFGTNEDKEQPTHIPLINLLSFLPDSPRKKELLLLSKKDNAYATYRQVLEIFGTEVCRTIDDDCHIRSAYTNILKHNPEIGIIPDGRFPNELYFFDKIRSQRQATDPRVWLIKHSRAAYLSNAPSENGLNDIPDSIFDLVIPANLDVIEKNNFIINFLIDNKVLSSTGVQTY